ncbi:hypothetical protein L873DRAFT_720337 [Choiromyces venosus 120613-1]|uniref:Uncharacterized protein n=1 Tax=Choiromyces venosus 120613-1 TaxID=1336337 RepID=A0A3N4JRN9_9PEZI|nr:hypothetical protein L873DRAFT_720337 [Choiromyces venosus 120613-1]
MTTLEERKEERKKANANITGCDVSSLVVDSLCDRVSRESTVVACFYFGFAAAKEHSVTGMLGYPLKQIINGLEDIPEEMGQIFRDHKKSSWLAGTTTSRYCEDATDRHVLKAYVFMHRRPRRMCGRALRQAFYRNSLKIILEKSPGTRIFVTGRPHIRVEIENRLCWTSDKCVRRLQ